MRHIAAQSSELLEDRIIAKYFDSFPEKAVAELEENQPQELGEILQGLSSDTSAKVLSRMKTDLACRALVNLPDQDFKSVYEVLDPVRSANLMTRAGIEENKEKIQLLSEAERKNIEEISKYPSESAGSLMDIEVTVYRANDTVGKVLGEYRKRLSGTREIFVLDIEGQLVGFLPVQELLFSDDETLIEKIMHKSPPQVNALAPKEEVIEAFEQFKTTALPVTHIDGTLLGAIRYTSLVKAAQNQALAAMASLGGASPSERVLSPPLFSVSKRLPWLTINLLTAFIASAVVGFFEGTIAKVTALAVLLPIVAGQSGNTGAQAMAVTMRGLALREVRVRQWLKILYKELRVGFVNGVAIAIVTGISVYFWSKNMPLGAVMTVAMIFSMIIASVSGAAIPVILTALGKDPAQSSSVILTTVTDVMGFLSFLGLATLFSSMLISGQM